jgi:3-hydroxyisobutyrate dehydrogenase-like beta-hydroxyacid dehydrogenase
MAVVALIGFGELGGVLGAALEGAGGHELRVWSRSRLGSLEEAVTGADLVISAVPGSASEEIADRVIRLLGRGACFADLTAAAPDPKERAARTAAARGVLYADGAVLGTVAASGHEVPIAAAGSGAEQLRDLTAGAGMSVEAIGGEAGRAAQLKLIRSVYMKGRDALVLEMMVAARRHGLEDEVARSIAGPGEGVPFTQLAERVLRALAIHADRRADELDASAALLREVGVEPLVTEASSERLRRLAALGLRERLGGERPADGRTTLDAAAEQPDF